MRVLHLFSNAKWTGPAEPALNLVLALRKQGIDADFACSPDSGDSVNMIVETARDRGLEPLLSFHLDKHRHPIKNWQDARRLREFLRACAYDLVHCHLDNDHQIAAKPAENVGIPLVRSSYEGEGFKDARRMRPLLLKTRYLLEPSDIALDHDAKEFAFPRDRMRVIPNAVDTERFDPTREVPDGRRWLHIPPNAFVVGIVARMQTHRHYEDFIQAIKRLTEKHPHAHAIVVGRGTNQETVGLEPVRRLGIEGRVHFPGYISGENYVGMIKAFDVNVFLVPGSDGTCRALREAMAMGKPGVVADRGMLREIIRDGHDGFVTDGSADALFQALDKLASNCAYTRELGQNARHTAESRYSLGAQAKAVGKVYQALLP